MSAVYHISQAYAKCTVWEGCENGERKGIHTTTPDAHLSRREKYDIIAKYLAERFGLEKPNYISIYREQQIKSMRKEAGTWTE